MSIYEDIEKAMDVDNRIRDFLSELDNSEGEMIDKSEVYNRLIGILARADDARFELKCRQGGSQD